MYGWFDSCTVVVLVVVFVGILSVLEKRTFNAKQGVIIISRLGGKVVGRKNEHGLQKGHSDIVLSATSLGKMLICN